MGNFLSLDAVNIALLFVMPGYIFSSFRSHFIAEQKLTGPDYIVKLLTLSSLNFALCGWMIYLAIAWDTYPVIRSIIWMVVLVIFPMIFGFLSGLASKKEWLRNVYGSFKLSPVHIIPTSWEYCFSNLPNSWILVVLKNGTKFSGHWTGNSFASTSSEERDLLIEKVYDITDSGAWLPANKSVLIVSGEISTIEFFMPTGENGSD